MLGDQGKMGLAYCPAVPGAEERINGSVGQHAEPCTGKLPEVEPPCHAREQRLVAHTPEPLGLGSPCGDFTPVLHQPSQRPKLGCHVRLARFGGIDPDYQLAQSKHWCHLKECSIDVAFEKTQP